MSERVTIKDIARAANVSVGTVDRALNNRGRISAETSKMIFRIAEEMHYKPNKLASALGKKKTINIAAVFPEQPDYFFGEIERGFRDAQRELSDYGLQIHHIPTENLNPKTQVEALRKIGREQFDGILVATGGEGLEGEINRLHDEGVPIATFNSDAVKSKRLFFIGVDYKNSGRVAASLLGKFCQGRGKVAVFKGFREVFSHRARKKGFVEFLKEEYPEIKRVSGRDYADRDDLAYESVRDYLKLHKDVTAVFVTSAPGTVGAGRAIGELPPESRPMLIGYDLNDYTAKLLRDRICWGIIAQAPERQSYYAAKTLLKYILEGSFEENDIVNAKSQIILRENLREYPEYEKYI